MRRRYRLKKKPIFILLMIVILLVVLIRSLNCKYKVSIEDIEVNSTYNIIFKITYKNEDISNQCHVTGTTVDNEIGRKKVMFLCKNKEVAGYVNVVDTKPPIIALNGSSNQLITLNSEYEEKGCNVIDNYDGELKANITGTVNTKKEGEYIITYEAKDSSDNESKLERKVIVTSKKPEDMSIKDFSLDGYFDNVKPKETKDAGEDYLNNFVYVGDSVPLYYVITGHISGSRLWHKEGLSLAQVFTQQIYIAHQESGLTITEAFDNYKPKAAIINLGMNSVASMTSKYFIGQYTKLIEEIKKVSPKTKLIVNSIPPVAESYDNDAYKLNNKKINEFNYYLLEMCDKLNIYFMYSAEVLKDSNGACKKGYYIDDIGSTRAHQTKLGNDQIFKYFRTHKINIGE